MASARLLRLKYSALSVGCEMKPGGEWVGDGKRIKYDYKNTNLYVTISDDKGDQRPHSVGELKYKKIIGKADAIMIAMMGE